MPRILDGDTLDRCSAIFGPPTTDDPKKAIVIIEIPKSTLADKAKKFIRKLLISKADRKAEKDERINNVLRLYQQRFNNDNGIPSPPESCISGTSIVTTATNTTDQPAAATDTNAQPTATTTTNGSTTAPQQEEINTSQTDLTAIISQLTAAVIATVTNAAQPATTATATTTPQTATTTAQSSTTTAQPSATTPQPATATAQSSANTPQAAATTAQPATAHTNPPLAAPSNPPTGASSSTSHSIPTQSTEPQANTNSNSSSARTRPEICGYFLDRPIPMIDISCHEVNIIPSRCQTMPRPIDFNYDGYGIPRIRSLKKNQDFISLSVFEMTYGSLRQYMGLKPYLTLDPGWYYMPLAIIGKGVNGYVTSVKPTTHISYTSFAIKPIEINSSRASIRERITNEVHLMNQGHKNIVHLHFAYSYDRCVYLVMEELKCNLRTLLLQSPGYLIPARTALHIFENVLSGLYFIHQLNYYHGGIRPENILLGATGQVKLGGFGSSGQMNSGSSVRNEIGLDFNAPDNYLTDKSDVWALAVTTRVLFDPYDYRDSSYSQSDIVNANTSIPPALKAMLLRMLAQNVQDRPSTTDLTDEFNQKIAQGILLPGTQIDVTLALKNTRQYYRQ